MYNKCESCGKQIRSAEDCKLHTNDGVKIHTYCKGCYDLKKQASKK